MDARRHCLRERGAGPSVLRQTGNGHAIEHVCRSWFCELRRPDHVLNCGNEVVQVEPHGLQVKSTGLDTGLGQLSLVLLERRLGLLDVFLGRAGLGLLVLGLGAGEVGLGLLQLQLQVGRVGPDQRLGSGC